VKIGNAELVGIQKKVILHARRDNKTVITAPQMMESMIHNLTPTRGVSDVAKAVLDYRPRAPPTTSPASRQSSA